MARRPSGDASLAEWEEKYKKMEDKKIYLDRKCKEMWPKLKKYNTEYPSIKKKLAEANGNDRLQLKILIIFVLKYFITLPSFFPKRVY